MLRIAEKAFRPDRFPFPLLHIDTEHNFPEVIAFRDLRAGELGERLIVRSVGDSIRAGRVKLRRPDESRNPHQTVTLLDAVKELELDALFGGGAPRRGEGAREGAHPFAPRRIRPMGSAQPASRALEPLQRATLAGRAPARLPAFQLDRARHLAIHRARRHRRAVDLFFARARGGRAQGTVGAGDGAHGAAGGRRTVITRRVRFRTVGDITCTCPVASDADTLERIIAETASATVTERGATRMDDQTSDASMELRKREGYF